MVVNMIAKIVSRILILCTDFVVLGFAPFKPRRGVKNQDPNIV